MYFWGTYIHGEAEIRIISAFVGKKSCTDNNAKFMKLNMVICVLDSHLYSAFVVVQAAHLKLKVTF